MLSSISLSSVMGGGCSRDLKMGLAGSEVAVNPFGGATDGSGGGAFLGVEGSDTDMALISRLMPLVNDAADPKSEARLLLSCARADMANDLAYETLANERPW